MIPRRWVVERTYGWLMRHRRLAPDDENGPHRPEGMIHGAMIDQLSDAAARDDRSADPS